MADGSIDYTNAIRCNLCKDCMIPCNSCFISSCKGCRFRGKTIIEKLIDCYSREYLKECKDECQYVRFALEKIGEE